MSEAGLTEVLIITVQCADQVRVSQSRLRLMSARAG